MDNYPYDEVDLPLEQLTWGQLAKNPLYWSQMDNSPIGLVLPGPGCNCPRVIIVGSICHSNLS